MKTIHSLSSPVLVALVLSIPALSIPALQVAAFGQAPAQSQTPQTPSTTQSTPASVPASPDSGKAAAAQSDKARSDKAQSDSGQAADAAKPADPPKDVDSTKDKDSKKDKDGKKDKDAKAVPTEKPLVLAEPGSQMEEIKSGSIQDVSAVGNRDIGARGMGNWYSTESEIRMGRQYAAEIEKSTRFITDPVVTEYVNRIGQNIVKNSDCKVPFTIKVIDSDEINAMALPGGFFYVNSGLILNADEEAEMAGVMAHETAHVCAHHAARQMTRANYAQLGTIPLIFIGGWTGYGIYEAANIGLPLTFLHFSREFEAQADYLGVQYMYRAGYDPQAFISFFEKVQALEKRKPGMVAKAFADHPQTPERIEHSQEEIAHILPAKDEYTVTTSEFDEVKARLARIENKRRLIDNKDGRKPSLRKASTSKDDPSTTAQTNKPNNPNDQPTLHRREDNN